MEASQRIDTHLLSARRLAVHNLSGICIEALDLLKDALPPYYARLLSEHVASGGQVMCRQVPEND